MVSPKTLIPATISKVRTGHRLPQMHSPVQPPVRERQGEREALPFGRPPNGTLARPLVLACYMQSLSRAPAVSDGVARRGGRRSGCQLQQRDAVDPSKLARGDRWCVEEGSRLLDRLRGGAGRGGRFTVGRRAGGASQTATCPPRSRERISRPPIPLGSRERPLHVLHRWHLSNRVRWLRHAQSPLQY